MKTFLKSIAASAVLLLSTTLYAGEISSSITATTVSGTGKTISQGGSYGGSAGVGSRSLVTPTSTRTESYITGSEYQNTFNGKSTQQFYGQSLAVNGSEVGASIGYEVSTINARQRSRGTASEFEAGVYTTTDNVGGNSGSEYGGYLDVDYSSYSSTQRTTVDSATGYTTAYTQ